MDTYPNTVLIVDDNAIDQVFIESLLNQHGITSLIASGGNEAISCLQHREVDMVLLDCAMPEIDGYQTCRMIRNLPADNSNYNVPIIAITGIDEYNKQLCLDAGMNDFIRKPVNKDTLYEKIRLWEAENQRPISHPFLQRVGHRETTSQPQEPSLTYNFRQRLDIDRLCNSLNDRASIHKLLNYFREQLLQAHTTLLEPESEEAYVELIYVIERSASTVFAYEIADFCQHYRLESADKNATDKKRLQAKILMSCNQTLRQIDLQLKKLST